MSAHKAIFSRLNALAETTGGVYPNYAPQSASKPYTVFTRVNDNSITRHMLGSGTCWEAMYQVSVVASTAASAYTVAEAIRADFDSLQGATVAGIQILRASLTSERDDSTLFNGSQDETYEVQMDFTIFYTRTSTP